MHMLIKSYSKIFQVPDKSKWKNPLEAMQDALALEQEVNQSLLDLHKIAAKHDDAQVSTLSCKKIIKINITNLFLNHNYIFSSFGDSI